MSLNNAAFDALFPDMDRIFEAEFESSFNLSELDDLIFELSEKKCFISNFLLQPFLLNSQGFSFHIFYNPQTEKDSGKVKIVATKTVEDENVVYYTAVLMGKVFKSQIR
jgi:hypothetical protein